VSAQALIILNLSDESFSDGGELSSGSLFVRRLQALKKLGHSSFDVGAQSTAPKRTRLIDGDEECRRFLTIFEEALHLDKDLWSGIRFLSLDTFRPATFVKIFQWLRAKGYHGALAFNDVSGCYREGIVETVKLLSAPFFYVLCHNRVPSREETPLHMNYLRGGRPGDILAEVQNYFTEGAKFLEDSIPRAQLIFDPCLGFAKSYEENWQLMQNVAHLQCPSALLIGISRKSFLRQKVREMIPGLSESEAMNLSEFYHYEFLKRWRSERQDNLWLRVHDPHLALLALGESP